MLARACAQGCSGATDLFEGRGEFNFVLGDVVLDHIHVLYIREGAADSVIVTSKTDFERELSELVSVTVVGDHFLDEVFFVVATCILFGYAFVSNAGYDQVAGIHVVRLCVLYYIAELVDVAAVIFDYAEGAAIVGSEFA